MLIINGLPIEVQSFKVLDPERIGEWGRTGVSGSLFSQVRAVKRNWQADTTYVTYLEANAIKAACGIDQIITVSNSIDGVSMTAIVRVGDEVDWQASSAGLLRRLSLTIREV